MSELLLELFSEEIPARMQKRAADDLKRLVLDGLSARGLAFGAAESFATPRRLVLVIADVAAESPALSEERKGPRVGAPEQAVLGFLKASGLTSIGQASVVSDAKKGDYYVAKIDKPGRPAADIIAETIVATANTFPWPKSMRWGDGPFSWVRPLKSVLCILGGKVVPFDIAGIAAGNTTQGHRFLGGKPFAVTSFKDYVTKLEKNFVVLDSTLRAGRILDEGRALAKTHKLSLVEDDALLAENAGLTEWPVAMIGTFNESFLAVPPECLVMAMKTHQKCFSLHHPKSGKLANRFLLVSNLVAKDGGAQIVAGNEKVIAARLSDAAFFWEQDLKRPLDEMASELAAITFHEKLGSQRDRVERIAELAHVLAGHVDADADDARRAAQLCKADLVSGMVGEFPELQGLMGRYYAEAVGTKPEIARAIELHYKPKGPGDSLPREDEGDAVAIAVALADKLDTLVGFWAIDEKPTGSGDPYQLRRAALGVIRIILDNDVRLPMAESLRRALALHNSLPSDARAFDGTAATGSATLVSLLSFFADRLRVFLKDQGKRHDIIDAVFALGEPDDLALIVRRVEALEKLLTSDDGTNLLAGVKRAANILAIEEKKDKTSYAGAYDLAICQEKEEIALAAAIESVKQDTVAALNVENFAGAMRALAELREPVDRFFDKILVNADDARVRENRLRLLSNIREATQTVADFSKISG